jgi:hypothetical protein
MGGKGSGRRQGTSSTASCGTTAAYVAHRRRGETPCDACRKAHREYYQKLRGHKPRQPRQRTTSNQRWSTQYRAIVKQWKLDQGNCVACGFEITEDTYMCIDCDHIDPQQKSFTISYQAGRWSDMQKLFDELTKCQALCRNCHAIRTHNEKHYLTRRTPNQEQAGLFDE